MSCGQDKPYAASKARCISISRSGPACRNDTSECKLLPNKQVGCKAPGGSFWHSFSSVQHEQSTIRTTPREHLLKHVRGLFSGRAGRAASTVVGVDASPPGAGSCLTKAKTLRDFIEQPSVIFCSQMQMGYKLTSSSPQLEDIGHDFTPVPDAHGSSHKLSYAPRLLAGTFVAP